MALPCAVALADGRYADRFWRRVGHRHTDAAVADDAGDRRRGVLSINELEHTIAQYTPFLLGDDPQVPEIGFTRKTKFLRKGLMAQDRPGWHAEILRTLDKAETLARKRHDYMHALVVHDFATNQAHLKILNRASPRNEIPDPAAIVNLASEAQACPTQ